MYTLCIKQMLFAYQKNPAVNLFLIIFLGLFLVLLLLLFRFHLVSNSFENPLPTNTIQEEIKKADPSNWTPYVNSEYGFALSHPPLLIKSEVMGGEYVYFVKFVENELSEDKGVSVGVSELSFEDEVEKIKKAIFESDKISPVIEKKINTGLFEAVRLEYDPPSGLGLEKRVIVVVGAEKYSYSVSTTPEQIDGVLESFGVVN